MDLSGNLWERVVSVGSSSGRSFDGSRHGDGVLDASGDANVTNWPDTTAVGVGLRGGSWDVVSSYARLSDRYYGATTVATRDASRGGRGARSEPIETDPYWSNGVLLLRGDGADGGTTFTDSSSSAKTVTVNGNTNTSATNFKTGNAAMTFDGLGDYLTLADSSDWDFGSGDFTIEFWYRTTTVASTVEILSQRCFRTRRTPLGSEARAQQVARMDRSTSCESRKGWIDTPRISIFPNRHKLLIAPTLLGAV